jgi:hypothetical protein
MHMHMHMHKCGAHVVGMRACSARLSSAIRSTAAASSAEPRAGTLPRGRSSSSSSSSSASVSFHPLARREEAPFPWDIAALSLAASAAVAAGGLEAA